MFIYFCVLLFIIVLGIIIFYKKENCNEDILKKKKKTFLIISFLVMFLIMAFRSAKLGTDTSLYISIFRNYSKMSWIDIMTFKDTFIGFAIFNKLISVISNNVQAILIGASAFICFLTGRFIYKNSNHVVYSTLMFILFYHYLNCFNIFRQYIAIMIVVNAFPLLLDKKVLKYVLCCLLAMSIHNTAIMALLLAPLACMKFNKKSIIIYTALMFLALLAVPYAMTLFSNLFPHYKMYFQDQYMSYSGIGLTILIIIYTFISLLAFISNNKVENNTENRKFMLLLMINNLAILANIMSYKFFILYRASLYYSIFLIVFIPIVFDRYKKNFLLYVFFFMLMLVPFTSKLITNDGQVVPYKSCYNNVFK